MNTFDDTIRQLLYEDFDSDDEIDPQIYGDGGGDGDGLLDTQWIREIETQIICDDYRDFIKTDITNVSFQFIYLNFNKEIVTIDRCILSLMRPNVITQNEIFQLIQKKQRVTDNDHRRYYNFMSLCFYRFYVNDDPKSVSQYLDSGDGRGDGDGDGDGDEEVGGSIVEYTNILSIEMIYLAPLIRMFHDLICFTVILFED